MPFSTVARSRFCSVDVLQTTTGDESNITFNKNSLHYARAPSLSANIGNETINQFWDTTSSSELPTPTSETDELNLSLMGCSAAEPPSAMEHRHVPQTDLSYQSVPMAPAELDCAPPCKLNISYTNCGINMNAKVTSVSDLRSLIEAFSKMCSPSSTHASRFPSFSNNTPSTDSIILCRNKSQQTKPVNYFASTSPLGHVFEPHSRHGGEFSLKQIVDGCIDTYFSCWIRYPPVIHKDEFMAWYTNLAAPTESLIVNAICILVFRHTVACHTQLKSVSEYFLSDPDAVKEQEEFFFNRARECLSQSFDTPDRYTVIALVFMSAHAEPNRQYHYVGMAVSALHELQIYPRMSAPEHSYSTFEEEMDTRLWWFVWAIDFYLYSQGAKKNTPQTLVRGKADLPRIFEDDTDEAKIGVLAYIHCLRLWQIQADIVSTLYEQEKDMTFEQLGAYDNRLKHYYATLPPSLQFESYLDSKYCEDLIQARARVNIEYNASRIILYKLYIPDMDNRLTNYHSLVSLGVCLTTALHQLRVLSTVNNGSIICAFDRDELWRAAEVISASLDICSKCDSYADRATVLGDANLENCHDGLAKAQELVHMRPEFKMGDENWIQVADWLRIEIHRHSHAAANLRVMDTTKTVNANKEYCASKCSKKPAVSAFKLSSEVAVRSAVSAKKTRSTFLSIVPPTLVQPVTHQQDQVFPKGHARFRYFNPRKANKLLFIDESP